MSNLSPSGTPTVRGRGGKGARTKAARRRREARALKHATAQRSTRRATPTEDESS